ncbi:hypothetical protein Tco_1201153 [Tanacetum coccineum]
MAEPLSLDHVFDFPADDTTLDLEDPDMDVEEDPKEYPEEDMVLRGLLLHRSLINNSASLSNKFGGSSFSSLVYWVYFTKWSQQIVDRIRVKTLKTEVGVQVSRLEDTEDIFSIGRTLEDVIFVVLVLVRNFDIPPIVSPPVGSPTISPPPLLKAPSDSDFAALVITDRTSWVPSTSSTFKIRGPSSVIPNPPNLMGHERRMGAFDVDIAFIEQATARVEDDVLALQTCARTAEARHL